MRDSRTDGQTDGRTGKQDRIADYRTATIRNYYKAVSREYDENYQLAGVFCPVQFTAALKCENASVKHRQQTAKHAVSSSGHPATYDLQPRAAHAR